MHWSSKLLFSKVILELLVYLFANLSDYLEIFKILTLSKYIKSALIICKVNLNYISIEKTSKPPVLN